MAKAAELADTDAAAVAEVGPQMIQAVFLSSKVGIASSGAKFALAQMNSSAERQRKLIVCNSCAEWKCIEYLVSASAFSVRAPFCARSIPKSPRSARGRGGQALLAGDVFFLVLSFRLRGCVHPWHSFFSPRFKLAVWKKPSTLGLSLPRGN